MSEKNYRLALAQALLDCIRRHEASYDQSKDRYQIEWYECARQACTAYDLEIADAPLVFAMCGSYGDFQIWAEEVVKGE